jgi:hypothetical protein
VPGTRAGASVARTVGAAGVDGAASGEVTMCEA